MYIPFSIANNSTNSPQSGILNTERILVKSIFMKVNCIEDGTPSRRTGSTSMIKMRKIRLDQYLPSW